MHILDKKKHPNLLKNSVYFFLNGSYFGQKVDLNETFRIWLEKWNNFIYYINTYEASGQVF